MDMKLSRDEALALAQTLTSKCNFRIPNRIDTSVDYEKVKESIELLSKAMGVLDLIVSEIDAAGGISPSRAI